MGNMLLMLYVEEIRSSVIWATSKACKSFSNIVMANLKCLYFSVTYVLFLFVPCRWTEDPQEKVPILQISDQRT